MCSWMRFGLRPVMLCQCVHTSFVDQLLVPPAPHHPGHPTPVLPLQVKFMGTRDAAAGLDFSGILEEEVESSLKAAAVISMGTEISPVDLDNIKSLCDQVSGSTAGAPPGGRRAGGWQSVFPSVLWPAYSQDFCDQQFVVVPQYVCMPGYVCNLKLSTGQFSVHVHQCCCSSAVCRTRASHCWIAL